MVYYDKNEMFENYRLYLRRACALVTQNVIVWHAVRAIVVRLYDKRNLKAHEVYFNTELQHLEVTGSTGGVHKRSTPDWGFVDIVALFFRCPTATCDCGRAFIFARTAMP